VFGHKGRVGSEQSLTEFFRACRVWSHLAGPFTVRKETVMQRLVCLTGLVAAVLMLDVTDMKAAVLTVYYDFEGVGEDRFDDPAGDFNDNLTGRYNSAFSNDVSSNAMGSAQSADFNGDSALFTDAFTTDLGPDRDAYTLMFWVKAADAQQGGGSRRLISTRVLPDGSEGNASWQVEGFGGGNVDSMDLRYQSAGYPAMWWNPAPSARSRWTRRHSRGITWPSLWRIPVDQAVPRSV